MRREGVCAGKYSQNEILIDTKISMENKNQYRHLCVRVVMIAAVLLSCGTAMAQNTQIQRQRKRTTQTVKPQQRKPQAAKPQQHKPATPAKRPQASKPQRPQSSPQSNSSSQRSADAIIAELVDNMVYVAGGTFQMGSASGNPVPSVTLSGFYIGRYEVTQEQWQAVMGSNPSGFKGAKRPVEHVSWDDCQEFIRKLNQLTGKNFRLPTEAEWEYAARGGNKSRGYIYSGSNVIGDVAWYGENSGRQTHNVGTKAPNELGLYDMSGNVLEWCQDWYDSSYYSNSPQTNPTGPSSGSIRVLRGGSWYDSASYCRAANRGSISPTFRYYNIGLRLAQ